MKYFKLIAVQSTVAADYNRRILHPRQLVDAANRINSLVVSANVHQTAQGEAPQPSTSTTGTRQQSGAFHKDQKVHLFLL